MALVNLLPRDLQPTTRVQKLILRISEDTFRIEHQRVKTNVIADVLSRLLFSRGVECETPERNTGPTPQQRRPHLTNCPRPPKVLSVHFAPPTIIRNCRSSCKTNQHFEVKKRTPQRTKVTQNRARKGRTPGIWLCHIMVTRTEPISLFCLLTFRSRVRDGKGKLPSSDEGVFSLAAM